MEKIIKKITRRFGKNAKQEREDQTSKKRGLDYAAGNISATDVIAPVSKAKKKPITKTKKN